MVARSTRVFGDGVTWPQTPGRRGRGRGARAAMSTPVGGGSVRERKRESEGENEDQDTGAGVGVGVGMSVGPVGMGVGALSGMLGGGGCRSGYRWCCLDHIYQGTSAMLASMQSHGSW